MRRDEMANMADGKIHIYSAIEVFWKSGKGGGGGVDE